MRMCCAGTRSQNDFPVELQSQAREVRDEVFYRVVFRGYLEREAKQIEKMRHIDKVRIPEHFDFRAVQGLRAESAEKLAAIAPRTLGRPGVSAGSIQQTSAS